MKQYVKNNYMTHKEDLLRLLKAEVEQLRKHYLESDAVIKKLEV